MLPRWWGLAVVVAISSASCGDPAPPSAVAVFATPDTGPPRFLDVPFPSDLYLGSTGTFEATVDPDVAAPVHLAVTALGQRRGFCRSCSIVFRIAGELDPASIPADAGPGDRASLDDAIVLLRADGSGEPIPLVIDHDLRDHMIVMRPRYGIALEPATRYVAVLTDRVRAADGSALAPDRIFREARDGGGGAAATRTRTLVEPVLTALEQAGLARARVVAAAVFTTEDGAWLLEQVKGIVARAPAPAPTVERVYRAADLDGLLGVPSEDRPGIDIVPADLVGTASIVHDAIDFVVLGTFASPRIVTGSGTDLGPLQLASDGAVTTGATPEQVPYVLVVPKNADLARLPVILVHPGMPGTSILALQVANTFARLGFAVLGIDPFQMGRRAIGATDLVNRFRELDGPDGFYEHDDQSVVLRSLGIIDAAPGHQADVAYGLGFVSQIVTDAAMSIRLLRGGDLGAIAGADAALSAIAFDPDQIYYLGQSFGGATGMAMLPIVDGVQAAILAVGPPDMVEHSCNGPNNRPNFELLVGNLLGVRAPFEEDGRRLAMHPYMSLVSWALEPISAGNGVHYLLDHRLDGRAPPDLLWLYASDDELLGQTSGEQVIGLAGVPVHGAMYLASAPVLTPPLTANRPTPTGTITAGAWIHDANHSLIRQKHVTISYQAPFFPPFERLGSAIQHVNPIEAAYTQMTTFFQTRRTTGRATIVAP